MPRGEALHKQTSNTGSIWKVVSKTGDCEVICRSQPIDFLGLHIEQTDRNVVGYLPRKSRASNNRNSLTLWSDADATTKEQLCLTGIIKRSASTVRHGKGTGIFEKKWSLLWKKKVKPIEIDLFIINLHLSKICVVRQVKG